MGDQTKLNIMTDTKKIGLVNLHIFDNSDATFSVIDEGNGPMIVVETHNHGNLSHSLGIITTPRGLAALGELFTKASQYNEYSPDYGIAADLDE